MWSVDHLDGGRRGAYGLYVTTGSVWDYLGVVGTEHIWRGGEEVGRALGIEQAGGLGIAKDEYGKTHCRRGAKEFPRGLWTGNQV
jgi:hypothetical protein